MSAFEIPFLADSVLIPGLIYSPYGRTIIYKGVTERTQPLVFQSLIYLEYRHGVVKIDDMKSTLWGKEPSQATFRMTLSNTSAFLLKLGVPTFVRQSKGVVTVDGMT